MSVVVFLSNQEVVAAEGVLRRGMLTVTRVCRAQAPEGSIINGIVTEEEEFDLFFKEFWAQNQLPKRNVTLVLGSAQALSRHLKLPKMSHGKKMEYLPREFAGVVRTKEPVLAYVKTGQEGRMERLLVNVAEREFLGHHIRRFRNMRIHLRSVVMASTADIMVFQHLSYIKGRTCVMQILDGMSVLNLLYVNGTFFQMNRCRILSDRGTAAFGMECARCILNLQQFLAVQVEEREITHVYLLGEFDESDVRVCQKNIQKLAPDLNVERLRQDPSGKIRFEVEPSQGTFEQSVAPIGGFLVSGKKNNLLYQYHHDLQSQQKRKSRMRIMAAAAGLVMVLGTVAAYQAFLWFRHEERVERQLEILNELSDSSKVRAYDELREKHSNLDQRIRLLEESWNELEDYPVCSSETVDMIMECAGNLKTARIRKFDAESGVIVVEISTERPEDVHRFAERLKCHPELFAAVSYSGYVWTDREECWKAEMSVTLTGCEEEDNV